MNWPQLDPILAIVVMGFAILTSLEKDRTKGGDKKCYNEDNHEPLCGASASAQAARCCLDPVLRAFRHL